MKTKLSVLALAMCGLLTFTSCDDDDNNYLPDQTVTKAFETKYPDAGKVEWETKNYEPLLERIAKGQQWHFKLRANPARKAKEDKGRRHRSDGIVGRCKATLPLISNCNG